jgi:hypothetical protein
LINTAENVEGVLPMLFHHPSFLRDLPAAPDDVNVEECSSQRSLRRADPAYESIKSLHLFSPRKGLIRQIGEEGNGREDLEQSRLDSKSRFCIGRVGWTYPGCQDGEGSEGIVWVRNIAAAECFAT